MGFRLWEVVRDDRKPLGSEQDCVDRAAAILVSQYGFEKSPMAQQRACT
jgi:hypothetical protein